MLQPYVDVIQQMFCLTNDGTYARNLAIFQQSLADFAAGQKQKLHSPAARCQLLNSAGWADSSGKSLTLVE